MVTKIAVFASGRGSNFREIYKNTRSGFIPAEISLLVSDNPRAGIIPFAEAHSIPVSIIQPKKFSSSHDFGMALLDVLAAQQIEYIVLAGYLKKIPENVVSAFNNRIINIHPALLPAFGGQGMYGKHVHQAVFKAGVKVSGITIHLVNEEYDSGPILLQRAADIADCETPEEIAAAVLKLEHKAFPEAIKLLLENEPEIDGNRVIIRKVHETN